MAGLAPERFNSVAIRMLVPPQTEMFIRVMDTVAEEK